MEAFPLGCVLGKTAGMEDLLVVAFIPSKAKAREEVEIEVDKVQLHVQ